MSLAAVSNQSHYEDLLQSESVYLAMTIGNPTSSEGELVIGECELSPEGITWINQFNNSVPNSVRRALELFIMIHGRVFRIREFIVWLRNHTIMIQNDLIHGTATQGAVGGSAYMSSRERAIRQRVGESLTQGGGRASDPLVEAIQSSPSESAGVVPRRLLASQEATLPTRNTTLLRPRDSTIDESDTDDSETTGQQINQQLHKRKINNNSPSLHLKPR